jgi:S1-C subfamily serine protease
VGHGKIIKEIIMADKISPLQAVSGAVSEIVAQAAPGVVTVHSHRSHASGFIWRPGLIVTADEALAEEGEISVVMRGGDPVKAKLAGRDPTTDVALLRVERTEAQPITFSSETVSAGALAVVVAAQDGEPTAALGVVSLSGGGWRSLRGGEISARIELAISLRRASEGGLALDSAGRAIGMAVFGPRRRVLVIPSPTIERVAAKLETHGRIPRGYLGLGLQPVKLDAGIGAMVMSVDSKGPGAAAGIRQGDVIVTFNGQPLRSIQALVRTLGPDSVGSVVPLTLRRAGEPVEASLTIGERPER